MNLRAGFRHDSRRDSQRQTRIRAGWLERGRFFGIVPSVKHTRGFILAIDGPAGSGKSTTARLCAERLVFRHLDTGAMYRAVTLKVLRTGTKIANPRPLFVLLQRTRVGVAWDHRGMRTFLDGRDVSEEIRSPEVSALVSEVSAISTVRRRMVVEQRRVAAGQAVVCEGRDIGSVVFPDADLKVFIECDAAERARRRQLELAGLGVCTGRDAVLANLAKRDRIDSGREVSPLRRMPDAVLLDTTHLTIEEQTLIVCDLVRRGCGLKSKARSQKPKAKAAELGGSEVLR
jgi:CMP/dCMP kinase